MPAIQAVSQLEVTPKQNNGETEENLKQSTSATCLSHVYVTHQAMKQSIEYPEPKRCLGEEFVLLSEDV